MFAYLRTLLLSTLFLCVPLKTFAGNTEHTIDVLVDVSGSMLQNDPDNKRISAVKLLIDLLPQGTRTGIWIFSEKSRLLTETSAVDGLWKKKAREAIQQIHSRGLYTNIEEALETMLAKRPSSQQHDLILLTDGMVDTSTDIMASADSRERVISELIPIFQQKNIRIHTIALSQHADKALLDELAFTTHGWAEVLQTATGLQKAFLRLFNKSIPQDTLPMTDNHFSIDPSVQEFSLLVFKTKSSKPSRLITPNKRILSAATFMNHLSWVAEQDYDLISVKQPTPGEWSLDAEADPDNQVMIVTDLKLQANEWPQTIAPQGPLEVKAFFTDKGQLIDRQDFLQLVAVTSTVANALGKSETWTLSPENNTGIYAHTLTHTLERGQHTITITAKAKTFQRQLTRMIDVKPEAFSVKTTSSNEQILIELIPNPELIDTSSVQVNASINREKTSDLETQTLTNEQNRLLLTLAKPSMGEKIIINFSVMARNLQGSPVSPPIKPVIIDPESTALVDEPAIPAEHAPIISTSTELPNNTSPVDDAPAALDNSQLKVSGSNDDQETGSDKNNWVVLIATVIGINILCISGGFAIYRWLKKRADNKHEQLLERLI